MATIKEVAQAAGVSIATVSRVYSGSAKVTEETAARVRSAAAMLDYWPNSAARSLSTNRTHVLGVLLPDLFGEFFSEVIRGIDREARRERFQILISSSHANSEEFVVAARSMRGRIDGLVAMTPDSDSPSAIEQIQRSMRVVLINPWTAVPGCDSVSIGNFDGAVALTRHLIRLGHRRIATVTGPQENIDAYNRLRGYRTALEEAGIEADDRLVLPGDFTEASGYASVARILGLRPRPTAVFAANDYMAIGLLGALRDARIAVPGDLAVAGFDDIPMAQYLSPALTTVRVDSYALGQRALQLWVRPDAGNGARRETLPTRLIVRGSCGEANPAACERGSRAMSDHDNAENRRIQESEPGDGRRQDGKSGPAPAGNQETGARGSIVVDQESHHEDA